MDTIVLPKVLEHRSIPTFFTELLALNKNISFRDFAQTLTWPVSLLNDVIHHRRGISIARVVEFGQCFKMTGVETEHLIMLALKDLPNTDLNDFVDEYLKTAGQQFPDPQPHISDNHVPYVPPSILADHDLCSLRMFLVWCQGKTTVDEIGRLLYLSPALKDPQILSAKMQILRDHGIIEGDFPKVKVLKNSIATTGMTRSHVFETLDPLRALLDKPEHPLLWRMSRLTLARADFPELHQRLNALVNWIQNKALNEDHTNARPNTDFLILQLNFMVTHLLNLPALGLRLKRSSNHKDEIVFHNELTSGTAP